MVPPPEQPSAPGAVVRPLRRDAQRNREVVLRAARRMFAAHGADCSFEDIARDAGVGVGTVYRRFPDRRALIEAILEQRVLDVDAAASEALGLEDPWAAARLFVGSTAHMLREDRGLRELLHDPGFVSAGLALLRRRLAPAAEDLALRLRTGGSARADLTGRDLLVLVRMLGSLAPDPAPAGTLDRTPAGVPAGTPADTADGSGDFERYLDLVLEALRCRPTER